MRHEKTIALAFVAASLLLLRPTHAGSSGVAGDAVRIPVEVFPDLPSPRRTALDVVREWLVGALAPIAEREDHVVVDLYDVNAHVSASFEIPLDGQLPPDQAAEVARFFGCRRSGRVKPIHPGTLAMLAEIAQRYPGHVIEVVSAYRGSAKERRTSPHKAGRAIDLRVRGVKTTEVRDWLWASKHEVGVGWYPHQNFLHIDVRPGQKDTAWTQPAYNADNDYHPRWAKVARKGK